MNTLTKIALLIFLPALLCVSAVGQDQPMRPLKMYGHIDMNTNEMTNVSRIVFGSGIVFTGSFPTLSSNQVAGMIAQATNQSWINTTNWSDGRYDFLGSATAASNYASSVWVSSQSLFSGMSNNFLSTFASSNWTALIVNNLSNTTSTAIMSSTNDLAQWIRGAFVLASAYNAFSDLVVNSYASTAMVYSVFQRASDSASQSNALVAMMNSKFQQTTQDTSLAIASSTNSLWIAGTNWVVSQAYVTASITNGILSSAQSYAVSQQQNISNSIGERGYVTQSVTNGLASILYVIGATNGLMPILDVKFLQTTNDFSLAITSATNGLMSSSLSIFATQDNLLNFSNHSDETFARLTSENNFTKTQAVPAIRFGNIYYFLVTNYVSGEITNIVFSHTDTNIVFDHTDVIWVDYIVRINETQQGVTTWSVNSEYGAPSLLNNTQNGTVQVNDIDVYTLTGTDDNAWTFSTAEPSLTVYGQNAAVKVYTSVDFYLTNLTDFYSTNYVPCTYTNITEDYINSISVQNVAYSNNTAQINGLFGGPIATESFVITQQQNLSNTVLALTNVGRVVTIKGTTPDDTMTNFLRLVNNAYSASGRAGVEFCQDWSIPMTNAAIVSSPGWNFQSSRLFFYVGDSSLALRERMVLDWNGQLTIGTTGTNGLLTVNGNIVSTGTNTAAAIGGAQTIQVTNIASGLIVTATNSVWIAGTNWVVNQNYVTQAITNGLASIGYVDSATNGVYIAGTNWVISASPVALTNRANLFVDGQVFGWMKASALTLTGTFGYVTGPSGVRYTNEFNMISGVQPSPGWGMFSILTASNWPGLFYPMRVVEARAPTTNVFVNQFSVRDLSDNVMASFGTLGAVFWNSGNVQTQTMAGITNITSNLSGLGFQISNGWATLTGAVNGVTYASVTNVLGGRPVEVVMGVYTCTNNEAAVNVGPIGNYGSNTYLWLATLTSLTATNVQTDYNNCKVNNLGVGAYELTGVRFQGNATVNFVDTAPIYFDNITGNRGPRFSHGKIYFWNYWQTAGTIGGSNIVAQFTTEPYQQVVNTPGPSEQKVWGQIKPWFGTNSLPITNLTIYTSFGNGWTNGSKIVWGVGYLSQ